MKPIKFDSKVKFVDNNFAPESLNLFRFIPVVGDIYTVRESFYLPTGDIAVHLNEIINPKLPHYTGLGMFEPSFNLNRFKIIEEKFKPNPTLLNLSNPKLN